jgi:hypothetical protein
MNQEYVVYSKLCQLAGYVPKSYKSWLSSIGIA